MTTETKRYPMMIVRHAQRAAAEVVNLGTGHAWRNTRSAIRDVIDDLRQIENQIEQRHEHAGPRSRWTNMQRPALVALYEQRATIKQAARAASAALDYYGSEVYRMTTAQADAARGACVVLVQQAAGFVEAFGATADRLADEADEEAERQAERERRDRALEAADNLMDVSGEALKLANRIREGAGTDAQIAALDRWARAWRDDVPAAAETVAEALGYMEQATQALGAGRREEAASNMGKAGVTLERAASIAAAGPAPEAPERSHPCGCAWGAHHFVTCPEAK